MRKSNRQEANVSAVSGDLTARGCVTWCWRLMVPGVGLGVGASQNVHTDLCIQVQRADDLIYVRAHQKPVRSKRERHDGFYSI